MNIFILDTNLEKCARYHCDQHVVKMILESAQMLCTVLNENGIKSPYRTTHVHHPCTLWAGESLSNWLWLRGLAKALNKEYKYRYNHTQNHKSYDIAASLPLPPIPDKGLTEFAQAMPEQFRVKGDPVSAYRKFYIGEKLEFATWSRRRKPRWLSLTNG